MPQSDDDIPLRDAGGLKELESEFRVLLPDLLGAGCVGGMLWNLQSGLLYVDRGGLKIFGIDPGEYDGRPTSIQRHMVPEELPALRAIFNDAVVHRDGYGSYFRVRRPGGGVRWAHIRATIQRDGSGTARRLFALVRDAGVDLESLDEQAVLETNRRRQTDAVQATTSALARALTVDDVRSALTSDEVLGPIGARGLGISLGLLQEGRLHTFASPSLSARLKELEYSRLDAPLPMAEAVRTQQPRFLGGQEFVERYPRLSSYLDGRVTASAILPLIAQAEPIGALVILYEYRENDFTPEEQNVLIALAAVVAQSVQRATLYDQDHAMAVGLQQSMLPADLPQVPGVRIAAGYRPARTGHRIGGDWYDVVPLPGRHVGLVIGDVEGHDVQASAVMGQLRTGLRAYAAEGHAPADLVARTSAFLRDLDTERFATCIYADLDLATGQTQFVRAGHHDPLLLRTDKSAGRLHLHGGLPLGLPAAVVGDPPPPYPVTGYRLQPGESLLLCTDGLLEHRGDLDAGIRRISAGVGDGPADGGALVAHIMASADDGPPQDDDIALLLVTRTGSQDVSGGTTG